MRYTRNAGDCTEMGRQEKKVARLEDRLAREAQASETRKETIRWQGGEVIRLHAELRRLRDQAEAVRSLSGEVYRLGVALGAAGLAKERLKARLFRASEAARSRSPSREDAELRKALRRSRRQKTAIKSLSRENTRLRKALRKSETRQTGLEVDLAKLRATGAVLSRRLFGRRSERQQRPRSKRRRGFQPGAVGHGRTARPALEEREDVRNPPADARVCAGCGQPYAANGARVSSIVEIEVSAHKRVIRRPRWRRRCGCASSPAEVSAPPAPRLFTGTPCGTSVWARFLFERYACFRPLRRVAAWLSDQGLAISAGTLGDSVHRFTPLFEPVAAAILVHQNEAAVRHGDETTCVCSRFERRPLEPRLAVDLGQRGRGLLPRRPLARSGGREEAVRRGRPAYSRRLRPLRRLQEAGAHSRESGEPRMVLEICCGRDYVAQKRHSRAGHEDPPGLRNIIFRFPFVCHDRVSHHKEGRIMFEDLFTDRDTIADYLTAPLFGERLRYLIHCARRAPGRSHCAG